MQKRMIGLNAAWGAAGLPQLRTRVGVNTGRAVAGNMGTDTIFNYTILGDCVNLASRLEGVNKEYTTLIIAGEDTWTRARDRFEFRELDWIRVKGKVKPVAIYELAGEPGDARCAPPRAVRALRGGAGALSRGPVDRRGRVIRRGRFGLDPADGPSLTLASRCAHYLAHPPDDWDGVHVMKTK